MDYGMIGKLKKLKDMLDNVIEYTLNRFP